MFTGIEKIIFICTGNTCRSPMAEVIFKNICTQKGAKCPKIESMGISALPFSPATAHAAEVMDEYGLDLSSFESKSFESDTSPSTYYVPMTAAHKKLLISAGISEQNIKEIAEISDPYGGTLEDYRKCRDLLEKELLALFERLQIS